MKDDTIAGMKNARENGDDTNAMSEAMESLLKHARTYFSQYSD
jgi:hypothetical protein